MSCSLISRRLVLLVGLLSQLYAGVPNISTRSPCVNSTFGISADLLVWYASQEVTAIWADRIFVGDNTSSWTAEGFDFNWDVGCRVGAHYGMAHDQWDTSLIWTYFRTSRRESIPFAEDTVISPEFFAAFLSGNRPRSYSAKWAILMNMFDWDLGRSYWVSPRLALRPFIGVKGGWIRQSIEGWYRNLTIDDVATDEMGHERIKNNFWGVGPLGGIDTTWRLGQFTHNAVDLFGDFSLANLWGTWTCNDTYTNTTDYKSTVSTKNSSLGALTFRGFMGLGWECDFDGGQKRLTTKLGYEMQIWFDQLRIATFQLQRLHGDLTLQGVTLNCRCDF